MTILKMDKRRAQTNEPEDKEVDNNEQDYEDDIDRLYAPRKEGGRRLTRIEDCVDTSI